jgi:hypothetical protein
MSIQLSVHDYETSPPRPRTSRTAITGHNLQFHHETAAAAADANRKGRLSQVQPEVQLRRRPSVSPARTADDDPSGNSAAATHKFTLEYPKGLTREQLRMAFVKLPGKHIFGLLILAASAKHKSATGEAMSAFEKEMWRFWQRLDTVLSLQKEWILT